MTLETLYITAYLVYRYPVSLDISVERIAIMIRCFLGKQHIAEYHNCKAKGNKDLEQEKMSSSPISGVEYYGSKSS